MLKMQVSNFLLKKYFILVKGRKVESGKRTCARMSRISGKTKLGASQIFLNISEIGLIVKKTAFKLSKK